MLFRSLVRKLAVIRQGSSRGSIAQLEERRSHKSVAGGSIPPRAIEVAGSLMAKHDPVKVVDESSTLSLSASFGVKA